MKQLKYIYTCLLILALSFCASGQISPGDLAEVHAHLEGMSNCTKCHSLGAQVSDEKCLACHTELKARIDQKKGYHSSPKLYKKTCTICHSDHHGRKFDILHFDITKFDHNLTGYKLEGAHAQKECKDCHKAENIVDPAIKKKKKTYLGLDTQCLSCHADYHQKTLSGNCADCHTNEKFKPASRFNHSKSKFPLKGQHKTVECVKCHELKTLNGKAFQNFTGLKFKNCVDCHADPHQNKFGQNCVECHSEESFRTIKSIDRFDHSKTRFNLNGRHANLTCAKCHKGSYTNPIKHSRCSDCHADYHNGEMISQNQTPDCKECHNEDGFQPSNYTIERHQNNIFRLEGAHIATPCIACHKKNETWAFKKIGLKCKDCHEDIHKSYLDSKYYPEANCLKCHSVASWVEVSFDHNQTKYLLTGKHQTQTCRSCHAQKQKETDLNLQFTGLTSTCTNCHPDEHSGQFNVDNKTECSKCHIPDGWKSKPFDHNQSRFKLDGKHKSVACVKCHPSIDDASKSYVLYKTGKIKCENCH
ncbi:MAG: cytochrome C [Lentimicrobiaceae bacterium]|nr:cytochrome C [Lentimicrobiaceae bacterium]MCB9023109.1 cytochrome C [Lentimicrobiaceae bacterium]